MMPRRLLFISLSFLLLAAASACRSREWKQKLITARSPIAIYIEHREKEGKTVSQGFAHPPRLEADRLKAVFRGLKYYPTGFLGVSRGPSIQPLFTDEEVAVLAGPVSRGLEKLGPDERLRFLLARTSWKPLFLGNKGISGVIFFDAPDRMNLAFDLLDESLPEDSVNPRAMVFADDPITIAGGDPVIVPPAGASLHPPAEDGATYPRWVVLDPAQVQVASEAPTPRPAPAAAPGPSPAAPPTPPPAVDEDAEALKRKLKNLDDLRRDGTISAEEYEKARQEILLQRGR